MTPTFQAKDPADIRNEFFDWTSALDANTTIQPGATVTSNDPALVVVGALVQGTKVNFSVSGGIAGRVYVLENSITTSGGETIVRHGLYPVMSGL